MFQPLPRACTALLLLPFFGLFGGCRDSSSTALAGGAVAAGPVVDVQLSSLELTNLALTPSFSPDIVDYTADAAFLISAVRAGAEPRNSESSVTINGVGLVPGFLE